MECLKEERVCPVQVVSRENWPLALECGGPLMPGEVTVYGTLAWGFNRGRAGGEKQVDFDINTFKLCGLARGPLDGQNKMEKPPSLSP